MATKTDSSAQRAWVVGGSIAGLLAAGALAKHCKEVFIVDRDHTLGEQTPRKGAPQGRHVHALLPRGVSAAESIFPGIFKEIIDAGANNGDLCGDAQWCPGGHRLRRSESNMRVIAGSRPFIESFFAKRVAALPNVHFITDTNVIDFTIDRGHVSGVILRDRSNNETFEKADIIVDAAGRGSQLPKWLTQHGIKPAPEESIDVKVGYATVRFKLSSAENVNLKALIIGASPAIPRGGIAQAVEHDVLQVSIAAYSETAPTDLDGFIEYSKSLPQPDLYHWMQGAEALDEVKTQRIPTVYRRSYHKVRGLPKGLIAIGDSICAFNPVFAQGMSVAAVEAEILDQCLAAGQENLSKRYFKAIRSVTRTTWQMGCTTDLSIPEVDGNLSLGSRIIARWIRRVQVSGASDSYIAERFIRVAALLAPPTTLLSPAFALRVLFRNEKNAKVEREPISVVTPTPVR